MPLFHQGLSNPYVPSISTTAYFTVESENKRISWDEGGGQENERPILAVVELSKKHFTENAVSLLLGSCETHHGRIHRKDEDQGSVHLLRLA
jgi:hypothetical protein